jgi:hypothetical protein
MVRAVGGDVRVKDEVLNFNGSNLFETSGDTT